MTVNDAGKMRILMIEDDEDDLILFKDNLTEFGQQKFEIIWQKNPVLALELLETQKFDVCFVDNLIGQDRGIDLIAQASSRDIRVPMVLVTGVGDREVDLAASDAGAVFYLEKDNLTPETLERALRYAALTNAKWQRHFEKDNSERNTRAQELRNAVRLKQIDAHLQPIIDCETLKLVKAEALIRWHHPKLGLLSPADFIAIAESDSTIVALGNEVLLQVCQYIRHLDMRGIEVPIAVNISIVQLERPDFANEVLALLASHNISPHLLELEITESIAMSKPGLVLSHMVTLQEAGIRFAIDDFGTGYSGLLTLREFPFDTVKIDRSFVKTAEDNPRHRKFAKILFYISDVLQVQTVVEGIETEEQFVFMRNYGADYAQGRFFAPPLRMEDFAEFALRFGTRKPNYQPVLKVV